MNEDEIDISSSSSSASSSRSTSPNPFKKALHHNETELIDDHETPGFDDELPVPTSINQQILKTTGELTLDELPPIEPINLTARLEELDQIGRVSSITGKLVVVVSFKGKPPLDLDSILFLRDCKPLGSIYETFGPVINPYYAIRFNSSEEIVNRGANVDCPVYFLPHRPSPITSYVFYKDLQKIKGSDASWRNDNEVPEEYLDFSDDEEERLFKLRRKRKICQTEDELNADKETKEDINESNLNEDVQLLEESFVKVNCDENVCQKLVEDIQLSASDEMKSIVETKDNETGKTLSIDNDETKSFEKEGNAVDIRKEMIQFNEKEIEVIEKIENSCGIDASQANSSMDSSF